MKTPSNRCRHVALLLGLGLAVCGAAPITAAQAADPPARERLRDGDRDERGRIRELLAGLSPEERRRILARLRMLTPEGRRALLERVRNYRRKPPEEQEEIRDRHAGFREWFRTLPPEERERLLRMPPPDRREELQRRIVRVRERYRTSLSAAEQERFDALPPEERDRRVLDHLRERRLERLRARFEEEASPEERRRYEALDPEARARALEEWGSKESSPRRRPHGSGGAPETPQEGAPRAAERGLRRVLASLTSAELESLLAWRPDSAPPAAAGRLPPRMRAVLERMPAEERARIIRGTLRARRPDGAGDRDRRPSPESPPGPARERDL